LDAREGLDRRRSGSPSKRGEGEGEVEGGRGSVKEESDAMLPFLLRFVEENHNGPRPVSNAGRRPFLPFFFVRGRSEYL